MFDDLREMRKELRSVPPSDREVAKGELVYKKLTTLESLAEIEREGQNAIAAFNATQQPKGATQEVTEKPKEAVYFVSFPKQELNEHIRPFSSMNEAITYSKTVSMLHGIDAHEASIQAMDKAIAESKGLHEAVKDAVAVPRHELERAQGREVSEQDGKILEAIDKYQDKHFSEGIGFNREEIESELLNHNLTIDFAESRLEHKFKEEKTRCNEQERDNGMER